MSLLRSESRFVAASYKDTAPNGAKLNRQLPGDEHEHARSVR